MCDNSFSIADNSVSLELINSNVSETKKKERLLKTYKNVNLRSIMQVLGKTVLIQHAYMVFKTIISIEV